jgi:hypothetical protein
MEKTKEHPMKYSMEQIKALSMNLTKEQTRRQTMEGRNIEYKP